MSSNGGLSAPSTTVVTFSSTSNTGRGLDNSHIDSANTSVHPAPRRASSISMLSLKQLSSPFSQSKRSGGFFSSPFGGSKSNPAAGGSKNGITNGASASAATNGNGNDHTNEGGDGPSDPSTYSPPSSPSSSPNRSAASSPNHRRHRRTGLGLSPRGTGTSNNTHSNHTHSTTTGLNAHGGSSASSSFMLTLSPDTREIVWAKAGLFDNNNDNSNNNNSANNNNDNNNDNNNSINDIDTGTMNPSEGHPTCPNPPPPPSVPRSDLLAALVACCCPSLAIRAPQAALHALSALYLLVGMDTRCPTPLNNIYLPPYLAPP